MYTQTYTHTPMTMLKIKRYKINVNIFNPVCLKCLYVKSIANNYGDTLD